MMRSPSFLLTLGSVCLGAVLGIAMTSSAIAGPQLPSTTPKIDPSTITPTKPIATTFMSKLSLAQLAKVPEAKLLPGIVLGPDTPIAENASIAFHCASWVQPSLEGQAANALFHAKNSCGGYGTFTMVWFKAQTDKEYMVECAGTSQKWRLIENMPGGVGQDTTFSTATTRPWMRIRPGTAGWHGVQISAASLAVNDSYSLTKCRVTPVAK
jgi:hypothetical protein